MRKATMRKDSHNRTMNKMSNTLSMDNNNQPDNNNTLPNKNNTQPWNNNTQSMDNNNQLGNNIHQRNNNIQPRNNNIQSMEIHALEELCHIASQQCPANVSHHHSHRHPSTSDGHFTPTRVNHQHTNRHGSTSEGHAIEDFNIELHETTDVAQASLSKLNQWTSLVDPRSRQKILDYLGKLQVPVHEHTSLSPEQNSQLHVLEQLSNYAYFLQKQENDPAYNADGMNGKEVLKNIRNKITTSTCTLRGALPLSSNEIENYVKEDVNGHLVPLETTDTNPALKRASIGVAVNMMLETLKQIDVSVETGSVHMPDHVRV